MQKLKNIIQNKYFRYTCWLILVFASFYVIDIGTRYASTRLDGYFATLSLYPNLFTISWILIFLIIFHFLNQKWGRRLYRVSILIFDSLSVAQLIHLALLGRHFNIYDLFSAGEGLTYFQGIITHFNRYSISIIIFSFIFWKLTIYFWPPKKLNNRVTFTILFTFLCLNLAARTTSLKLINSVTITDSWDSNMEPSKVYELFSNPTSSFQLTGIYEYTFREIYLFLTPQANLSSSEITTIANYLDSRNLDQTNSHTGLFKDKNVIMIMMESVDNTFLNKEIMPTLSSLTTKSLYFTNRYSPIYGIGATFNSEFTSLTGTYSSTYGKAAYFYPDNDYTYALPNLFKASGYSVNSFHMNKGSFYDRSAMHTAFGFERYNSFLNYTNDYIYSDSTITDNDSIYHAITSGNRFFSYIITYSPHMPYTEENITCQNYMQDSFYNQDDYETSCLKSALYDTDTFINKLIKRLDQDNLLDNTVIILYGDHLVYAYNKRVEAGGNPIYDLNKGVYLIYNKNTKPEKIDTINTTIDMLPTIANLFALNNYNPSNYLGVDTFNKNTLHLAYFSDYNWYDGKVYSAELDLKTYQKNKSYYDSLYNYTSHQIDYNNLIVTGNFYKNR